MRLEPLEDRRLLAVFTVNTKSDVVDAADGLTSLREAISAPNIGPDSKVVDFAPALTADGPASILLTHGELVVNGGMTIRGPGAGLLSIDASGNDPTPLVHNGDGSRVFRIQANGVTLRDLQIVGGDEAGKGGAIFSSGQVLTLNGTTVRGNYATDAGGGIFHQGSQLVVMNSVISGNTTTGANAPGGGLAMDTMMLLTSRLTIDHSLITENTTAGANSIGGGVYGRVARMTISDSTISGNTAAGSGGGLAQQGEYLTVDNSLLYGNRTASSGGGAFCDVDSITITNSTLSTNFAGSSGGGVYLASTSAGGTGAMIKHSTIFGNEAGAFGIGVGGGVFVSHGPLALDHTIVAGNTAGFGRDVTGLIGQSIAARYSLIGSSAQSGLTPSPAGNSDTNGNRIGGATTGLIDPMLTALADNGGPTRTHGLLAGSPAVDAGDAAAQAGGNVPLFDERGTPFGRVAGNRIDIGAIERQNFGGDLELVVDTLADESDGDLSPGDVSLREAIGMANGNAGFADTIHFALSLASDTIVLTLGELRINDATDIAGLGAAQLTIDASGNDPTPSEKNGDGSRIFNVDDGRAAMMSEVVISGLTLTGGDSEYGGTVFNYESLTIATCTITGNSATLLGGGLASFGGRLDVIQSTISNNSSAGDGGGIFGKVTEIEIVGSLVTGNSGTNGGGILSYDGELDVLESQIADNVANGETGTGGGIHSHNQSLAVAGSTITGNSGFRGGGIYSKRTADVTLSTVAHNTAAEDGGGIDAHGTIHLVASVVSDNAAGGDGGGVRAANGLTLKSSTVARNSAGGAGGGAWVRSELFDDPFMLLNSTISSNSSADNGAGIWLSSAQAAATIAHGTLTLNDVTQNGAGGGLFVSAGKAAIDQSIIAGNLATVGTDFTGLIGSLITVRYSLIGSNANSGLAESPDDQPDANGNLVGGTNLLDPNLGPLADNGGPTPTHALTHNNPFGQSPAINAGDPSTVAGVDGVPVHDQRGAPFTRVYGGRIDIGAVETLPSWYLPGNYNANGVVDAADYTVWRNTSGSTSDLRADGNGDGIVDALDYAVWKSNYGATVADVIVAGAMPAGGGGAIEQGARSTEQGMVVIQAKPPAEPGAVGRESSAARIGDITQRPPALPGINGRLRHRATVNVAMRQDRLLEAWLATRTRDPHPGPLPEGEGVESTLAEPVAHDRHGEQAEADARDWAFAEMDEMRLALGE